MHDIENIEKDILNSKEYEPEGFPIPCGRYSFYKDCMSFCKDKQGMFLEFGVFQGGTINFMSSLLEQKTFFGFDSFDGLPEKWEGICEAGHFRTEIPEVNKNVILVKGLFQDTLENFLLDNKNKQISFAHIDCDLYSSVDYVLRNIEKLIEDDCLFIFDDFLNFPNYKNHSIKAFEEFLNRNNYNYFPFGVVKKEEFSRVAFIIKVKK